MSLSGLSRADRLLWSIVLVAAALVALITWLVLPAEKIGGIVREPSTFFNVGYGTKAAYLVLDRLEYPVTRLRRPIRQETLNGIGVLFILKPFTGLQAYEMADLEAWVREGHALVVVPGSSLLETFATRDGAAMPPPDRLGPEEPTESRRQLGTFFEDWFSVDRAAAAANRTPPAVPGDSPGTDQSVSSTEVDAGDPICAGIRQLTAGNDFRFTESPLREPLAKMPAKVFWKDSLGTVGLQVRLRRRHHCGPGRCASAEQPRDRRGRQWTLACEYRPGPFPALSGKYLLR